MTRLLRLEREAIEAGGAALAAFRQARGEKLAELAPLLALGPWMHLSETVRDRKADEDVARGLLEKAEGDEARGQAQEALIAAQGERERAEQAVERLKTLLLYDARIKSCAPGSLVVRQGDYGSSAYVVLQGGVRVVLSPSLSAAQTGTGAVSKLGVVGALFEWLRRPRGVELREPGLREAVGQDGADEEVPILLQDVPAVLRRHRTAVLAEGELFGEIAAMTRAPRTASVFADESGAMLLELRWQGLRDLRKNDRSFQRYVEQVYRRNALRAHLRATPGLRKVGDSPAIRACLKEAQAQELFSRHLGWEPQQGSALAVGLGQPQITHQLTVLSGPLAGKVHPLDPAQETVLGRGTGSTFQPNLQDPTISRRQCTLAHDGQNWLLTNHSRFRTIINGAAVRGQRPVSSGDEITIGATRLRLETLSRPTGDVVQLELLALLPPFSGEQGANLYRCALPRGLPSSEVRGWLHQQVVAQSSRYVVVFQEPGSRRETWQWCVPEDEDDLVRTRQDVTFDRAGPPPSLLLELLKTLALEQISRETEFQSHGELTWSGRTPEERQHGVDWARWAGQEPMIAAEGSYPNGLILVRAGFTRLSRTYDHGQRTLAYLGKGAAFGLEEIAHNWRLRQGAAQGDPVPYQHTLRALGYADVLLIPTSTLERYVLPTIPEKELPPVIDEARLSATPPRPPIEEELLEQLVERRTINGQQAMLIDLDRCTRCDDCVRGCASAHQGNPRFVRHGPRWGRYMVANACMHCADPVCMIQCPTGAIHRTVQGEVVINDPTCIGCATCANNCPYDNIRMVAVRDGRTGLPIAEGPPQRATKCDLCYDRPGGPACVRACPHDALARVDLTDLQDLAAWLR